MQHRIAAGLLIAGLLIAGCSPQRPRLAYATPITTMPAPVTAKTPARAINCQGEKGERIEVEEAAGPFTKISTKRGCRGWIPTAAVEK